MARTFDGLTAVHYQRTDPGARWAKDAQIAIDLDTPLDSDKVLTPNVIRLPGGGFRIYYTGLGPGRSVGDAAGYILSARSHDAVSWVKDPGVRVDLYPPHAALRTLCPDVIPLADGGYRMYFEARSRDRPTVILSALSDDGLDFQPEAGVRFGDDSWSYGTPRCLYIGPAQGTGQRSNPRYRLYFHKYTYPMRSGIGAGNEIVSATSVDGLNFQREPGVRIAQTTDRETMTVYSPEVVRLGDGTYRMFYAAWSDRISGGVFSATSHDGVNWVKDEGPCVELGGPLDSGMVSEPCVIGLDDGRSRLFYEARDDEGRCRILSATSLD